MGSNRAPDLTEIVEAMILANRRTMFGGWLPGKIVTYDASKCKASVQILLLQPKVKENGDVVKEPVAVINEVPVVTFTDHYGVRVELALQADDYVTVFFSSRNVDRWLQKGGMVDPDDDRDHDLNDAIAFPMLLDFAHVSKPTAKIQFTQSTVEIGGTNQLAEKSALDSLKAALVTAAAAQTTAGNAPGAAAITAIKTALDAIPGWPQCTTVLKGG